LLLIAAAQLAAANRPAAPPPRVPRSIGMKGPGATCALAACAAKRTASRTST